MSDLRSVMPAAEALALGDRYRHEGRLAEAEALCRQILQALPNEPDAAHQLGLVAYQGGRLGEAIEHIRRAVSLAPSVTNYHINLGEMLRQAGQPDAAAEAARRALTLEPGNPVALSNLGAALYDLGDYAASAEIRRKVTTARPDFPEGHCGLGNALFRLRRYDEAIDAYHRALALKPGYPDALANLGTTLHHAGRFDDGIATLRHAIALAPQHAGAHSGLGLLLLMRGDFAEGFEHYDWRLQSSEQTGPRFPVRPLQGGPLAGQHVYVQAEQGLGDTLQFVRYIPMLSARGATVTLRVQQDLVALLQHSLPGVTVLGDRAAPTSCDCDAALLSLPRLFNTRLETIPAAVPYLRVPDATGMRWQQALAALPGLRVGIAWAGNPGHMHDVRRSIDVRMLAPLLGLSGVSCAGLQVGPRAADAAALKPPILDLSLRLVDFAETAGAVAALDLVITVDTAVAHLAGALGKPVWLLLASVADWRWLIGREDSPWYPTMRLFRRQSGEEWSAVIARVGHELRRVVRGDKAPLMPC